MKIAALYFSLLLVFSCANDSPKRADEAQMHYQLAQSLLQKGENTQGMSELLQAVELDPKDPEIHNLLALAYVQHDRLDLAEVHVRKAISLDPKYSEAQNHLCAILIQKEKYDEAIEHCTKAVSNVLYSTPERAYQNLGVAYQKKGDLPKAIDAFRKALIHNNNFVMSRKSLGLIYVSLNQYPEAVKEFDAAGKICLVSPKGVWGDECPEVFYNLGLSSVKVKSQTKAVSAFKSCIDTDEQGTYGEKCRAKLKILE